MNIDQNGVVEETRRSKRVIDLVVILVLAIVVFIVATLFDILERIVAFSQQHENWEIDEIITVSIFLVVALAVFSLRRFRELKSSECELKQRYNDLQETQREIHQLRGIFPICASCKKIRDDQGFWHQVESYIRNHSEAEFSHGICPECMKKLYPDFVENDESDTNPSS